MCEAPCYCFTCLKFLFFQQYRGKVCDYHLTDKEIEVRLGSQLAKGIPIRIHIRFKCKTVIGRLLPIRVRSQPLWVQIPFLLLIN